MTIGEARVAILRRQLKEEMNILYGSRILRAEYTIDFNEKPPKPKKESGPFIHHKSGIWYPQNT